MVEASRRRDKEDINSYNKLKSIFLMDLENLRSDGFVLTRQGLLMVCLWVMVTVVVLLKHNIIDRSEVNNKECLYTVKEK